MRRTAGGNRPGALDWGLYRTGHEAAALWWFVSVLGRWWGLEVRWDPDTMGRKIMWTFADLDIGWLE